MPNPSLKRNCPQNSHDPAPDIKTRIAGLEAMSIAELKKEWRSYYKSSPPVGFSQDMLIRAIAYRMQEQVFGGLDARSKRKLKLLAEKLEAGGTIGLGDGRITFRSGTRLVRAWQGKTHRVLVLTDGFEYEGEIFASLSHIANKITGSHWSGPRFFGLKKNAQNSSAAVTE